MCRRSAGDIYPDAVLKADTLSESKTGIGDSFRDIWDFIAFHKKMPRKHALLIYAPSFIMLLCLAEIERSGATVFDENAQPVPREKIAPMLIARARGPIENAYESAMERRDLDHESESTFV